MGLAGRGEVGQGNGAAVSDERRVPALLRLAETAPFLRRSRRTIRQWVADGDYPVPTRVIAGNVYVRRVDLEEYLGVSITAADLVGG